VISGRSCGTRSPAGSTAASSTRWITEQDALNYAMQFARDMPVETADKFVAMWVNSSTLGYTDRDRQAVQLMLDEGFRKG
jgi:predicted solute-binding protein